MNTTIKMTTRKLYQRKYKLNNIKNDWNFSCLKNQTDENDHKNHNKIYQELKHKPKTSKKKKNQ